MNFEKEHQKEYMSTLYPEIDFKDFLDKPIKEKRKIAQKGLNIPDIGTPDTPGGSPVGPPATPGATTTPPGDVPPAPGTDSPPVTDAGISPAPPPTVDKNKVDLTTKKILDSIEDIKYQLDETRSMMNISIMKDKVMEEVNSKYKELEDELNSLKERKIPEKKYFDTEGAFRDTLYGIATNMLDEFLPELFDEVPDYSFTATQVSRTFEDGTVADAIISLMATVPKEGMRYDFKIDIPILNGLMQYPLYIQRGRKIIPLTKPEIQRELNSLSYRKMDVDLPYRKDNIFNNIGENIHRKPDKQKWYPVIPNGYKSKQMPANSKYPVQRGK